MVQSGFDARSVAENGSVFLLSRRLEDVIVSGLHCRVPVFVLLFLTDDRRWCELAKVVATIPLNSELKYVEVWGC